VPHIGNQKTLGVRKKEEIVRRGYDKRAQEYNAGRRMYDNRKELEEFVSLLPESARILDAGCGAGVPVSEFLITSGFDVTGIDFSGNMIKLARKNVPEGEFTKMDMTQLGFYDNSFDGLTAFYSIIHVPRQKHISLFRSFHRILKPDGVMLICMGPDEWEATGVYCGTEMFWSHYSPEKSLRLVNDAGFQVISDQILERGGEKHYWITARNKK
jgi:ubiquinone/menaquinone biosynthesis C-methylase UbiE